MERKMDWTVVVGVVCGVVGWMLGHRSGARIGWVLGRASAWEDEAEFEPTMWATQEFLDRQREAGAGGEQ